MSHHQSSLLRIVLVVTAVCMSWESGNSFVFPSTSSSRHSTLWSLSSTKDPLLSSLEKKNELLVQKRRLKELLGPKTYQDPVLADPITKEGIEITASEPPLLGSTTKKDIPFDIKSPTHSFRGSSDTYLDLLEPVKAAVGVNAGSITSSSTPLTAIMRQTIPYIPPSLRSRLSPLLDNGSNEIEQVIPMRDLFTSPAVSFAYERGWRQGFVSAGFPGPDVEAQMAMEYFAPVIARVPPNSTSVVVDMSCATGLFTRRFALSEKYGRVLGCDYSPSMLTEARRRIDADPRLSPTKQRSNKNAKQVSTALDLVRLDVGRLPMQTESVDCLHAGAAMHCWPDLDVAASEIYRILKPGGRYFATTFLSRYFSTISAFDGQASTPPSQQAFQYFESIDTLRDLLVRGGFAKDKILIEILGTACVVIRAEK